METTAGLLRLQMGDVERYRCNVTSVIFAFTWARSSRFDQAAVSSVADAEKLLLGCVRHL